MPKNIQMFHPETNQSRPLPIELMTQYMLAGWIPAQDVAPSETFEPEDAPEWKEGVICETDIDASEAVDKDIENAVFEESSIEHTKENILIALEDVDILNAAIFYLGDLQTEDELSSGETSHRNGAGFSAAFSRTGRRLWMWVSGKDPKSMEVRWDPKCLSHTRADRSFARQLNNYEDFSSAIDLAKYVAGFHWRQLSHILLDTFQGLDLPKADQKLNRNQSSSWMSLSGASVLNVKGGGTQILWDSRKIWLPTSRIKNIHGKLSIPNWLAEKNDMI